MIVACQLADRVPPAGLTNSSMAPPAKQRPSFEVELQAIEDYRRFAALTIQRYYRGWIVRLHRARKEAARREREQSAAAQQAEAARLYKAARAIQDSWRRYRNKRIYRFYRDLIKFREAAEPRQLLRSINAPEAALVDPAAGLHIRLRLGGSTFPPILLYKVFTHRPVTDICAFGPRNYAAEAAAAKTAAPAAAAGPTAPAGNPCSSSNSSRGSAASRSDWYSRDDRNGWRPVIELQQQRDSHQHGARASSSSTNRRGRHRGTQMRQRRTRLQLLHGSSSAGRAGVSAAGSVVGDESGVWEAGYESEPEPGREGSGSAGAGFLHRKQPQQFHHSPLVRRAERAQKLKQRRRQWLLKMYRTGLQAAAGGAGIVGLSGLQQQSSAEAPSGAGAGACQPCAQQQQQQQVQQAQPPGVSQAVPPCERCSSEEQLLRQLEQQLALSLDASAFGSAGGSSSGCALQQAAGAGGEVRWEDGEDLLLLGLDAGILAWAQKLDFDSYQQQWSSTAVTLGSEVAVPQSERLLLQQLG